ncbi:MAG TPA: flagellar basal-body rod protein FlgG [Chitinispirillaceae bacterium]|nr:flagellar basal-body rod protein FlgG [Chitinispirillaceae bacterium]
MIQCMMTAATGMEAQQLYMDTISNNLSNVNTAGFKRSKIEFQDLMYQTLREPGVRNFEGAMAPAGIETGLGVRPAATQRIFEQGAPNKTENDLDWAIQGEGLFQITLPDGGTAYTRDGSFKLSSDGSIVTSSGFLLSSQITVPEGSSELTIAADGRVSVKLQGEDTSTDIGQIELARFINPSGLRSLGGNLFQVTDASGEPVVSYPGEEGTGTIMQGYTESSNVQVVDEMVNMISAQRAFEIVSKSIQCAEDMLQVASNLKR